MLWPLSAFSLHGGPLSKMPSLMRSIHSYHAVSQSIVKADQRRSHHHRSRTCAALSPRRYLRGRAFALADSDAVRLPELSPLEAISAYCSTCARPRAVVNIIHKAAAQSVAQSEPFVLVFIFPQ